MEDTASHVFKIEYDGDLRRFEMPGPLCFQSMEQKVREIFFFSDWQHLRFRYLDQDGDMITVASDLGLNDNLAESKTSPHTIRLYVDLNVVLPQTMTAELEKKQAPEPQNEAAEPEVQPIFEKKSCELEKKRHALTRLSTLRCRLVQRQHNFREQSQRAEQKAMAVSGRIDNVDRRIHNLFNKFPELAASFPELDSTGAAAILQDRSRSNLFCDSCDIGILAQSEVHFHCDVCGNFDLCERCERQFGHEHDLLRIERGTRRLPAFFDLTFDSEVRTLEACCLDVWRELEASGLLCLQNVAILLISTLLSLVLALTTAYAVCSAIFSVMH